MKSPCLASWMFSGAILLAGCGASEGPAPEPAPDEAFVDQFCADWVAAACQARADCRPYVANVTTAECAADRTECVSLVRTLNVGVAAGRLSYDATAAHACFDSLGLPTCRIFSVPQLVQSWPPLHCVEKAFAGHVAPGGRCHENVECAGGDCRTDPCLGFGTCVRYAGIGEKCRSLGGSPTNSEPDCDPAVAYCLGTCLPRTADGACGGGMFASGDACTEGSFCDTLTDQMRPHCRPLGGEGTPCTGGGNDECTQGLTCQDNTSYGVDGGRCGPRRSTGGPCTASNGDQCEYGLACRGADPTTGAPGACGPFGERGDPCLQNEECVLGLYCDGANHACADRPGLGGVCDNSGVPPLPTCFGGALVCITPGEDSTGICGTFAALGEPCAPSCSAQPGVGCAATGGNDPYRPCAADLRCLDGVCKAMTVAACTPS